MPITTSAPVTLAASAVFRIEYVHIDSSGPSATDIVTVPFAYQNADGTWTEFKRVQYTGVVLGAIMTDAGGRYDANVAAGQSAPTALRNAIRSAIYRQAQTDGVLPAGAIS